MKCVFAKGEALAPPPSSARVVEAAVLVTADDEDLVARLCRRGFLRASNVAEHRVFLEVLVAAHSLLVLAHVHLPGARSGSHAWRRKYARKPAGDTAGTTLSRLVHAQQLPATTPSHRVRGTPSATSARRSRAPPCPALPQRQRNLGAFGTARLCAGTAPAALPNARRRQTRAARHPGTTARP